MEDKKVLKETKTIFNCLKTELNSVSFSEAKIDKRLLKKIKKSKLLKDSQLLKLLLLADNKDFLDDDKTPTRTDYIEKGKLIGLPYTILIDLFIYFMQMFRF